jgi:hypothetical protein
MPKNYPQTQTSWNTA